MAHEPKDPTEEYIGDGIYATFDGFQIWLSINGNPEKLVALEPAVMRNLVAYSQNYMFKADRPGEPAT